MAHVPVGVEGADVPKAPEEAIPAQVQIDLIVLRVTSEMSLVHTSIVEFVEDISCANLLS